MNELSIGEQLSGWGKVAILETRGRTSGIAVQTPVGFVDGPDGALLVAAGSESTDWALNLRHDPRCTATIGDTNAEYVANELEDPARAATVSALILKYGTPAEGLGRGPVFRLIPVVGT